MRQSEIVAEETMTQARGPRPLKIVLSYGASGGWLNMGDTAMLQNIVAFIGTAMPNATITCLSERLDRTTELIDTEHVPSLASYCERRGFIATAIYRIPRIISRKRADNILRIVKPMWFAVNAYLDAMFGFSLLVDSRARRLLHTMRDCDALWALGGGYLGDQWFWPLTWPRLLTYASFKWHGKPVVLSGQQIGPLTGRARKWLMSFFLNHYVDILYVRDTTTAELLGAIQVRPDIFRILLDDAGTLPPVPREHAREILRAEAPELKEPYIVANYRMADYSGFPGADNSFALFLDSLVESTGMRIVFVSLSYTPAVDDRVAAQKVISAMKNSEKAHALTGEYKPQEIKAIIGLSKFAIGASHHFALFSLVMGVPTLCLYKSGYYLHKFSGLTNLFGHPNWLVRLEDLNTSTVIDRALDMINQSSSIGNDLNQFSSQLSSDWRSTIQCVLDQLSRRETCALV